MKVCFELFLSENPGQKKSRKLKLFCVLNWKHFCKVQVLVLVPGFNLLTYVDVVNSSSFHFVGLTNKSAQILLQLRENVKCHKQYTQRVFPRTLGWRNRNYSNCFVVLIENSIRHNSTRRFWSHLAKKLYFNFILKMKAMLKFRFSKFIEIKISFPLLIWQI